VTVLIGLSYNKKAVTGIIATPFKKVAGINVFQPCVTIGSVLEQEAYDFTGKDWIKKIRKYPINRPLKIATSNSR
jgi:hypothetical protein